MRPAPVVAALAALVGCGQAARAPSPAPATATAIAEHASALIVDATRGNGTPGFHWIPPMTTTAAAFTTLDQTGAANGLTVRIDRLYADLSIDPAPKATFTGSAIQMVTGTSSATFPGVTGPFYGVNWAPGAAVAAGQTYRVSVQAGSNPTRILGVADVQVVASATAAGQVDRTRFTPLVVGSTLAVVFRLEAKDTDGDTLNDWRDDCPLTKNASQLDSDGDGVGDACQCLNMANGTPCRTACHTGQTCQSGACSGGSTSGNGTACSTGNLCKTSETCTSGACGGGSNRGNGTACTTGNPCKTGETCTSGACGGGSNRASASACATGNPCKQNETCTNGACGGGGNRGNGSACSTGNACKQSEVCTTGVCGGGSNRPNGTACGDRNLCTQTDTCQSGLCAGGAVVCPAADACHVGGACDRTRGVCPAVRADGTSCTDSNACTQTDTCVGGTCTGGNPKTCTAQDGCHLAGTCAPTTGVCSNPPRMGGTCGRNPYEYDGGGRLVRDGDVTLVFDGHDQLRQLTVAAVANPQTTAGLPAVPMRHTYGYEGLRTSTVTNDGLANQTVDYWFTEDYAERSDGRRDHYLRVGDRVVARLSYRPPAGTAPVGALTDAREPRGPEAPPSPPPALRAPLLAASATALALLALGLAALARLSLRRRAAAALALLALPAALAAVPSCRTFDSKSSAVTWTRVQELYFHQGVAAGPTLLTDATGAVFEERRYEPFGQPIDAFRTATGAGTADFTRDPRNELNKETDPATQWSYHGARWMAPQTARWLSPDPAVKGPNASLMEAPWDLNPYAYVRQSPTLQWDPDGAAGDADWEPVNTATFRRLAAERGIGKGMSTNEANVAIGAAFEQLALRLSGAQRNTKNLFSLDRALVAKENLGGVRPDGISDQLGTLHFPSGREAFSYSVGTYFVEAKAVNGTLSPASNDFQITGLMDVADQSRNNGPGRIAVPHVSFLTTSDTKLHNDVTDLGYLKTVTVGQRVLEYCESCPFGRQYRLGAEDIKTKYETLNNGLGTPIITEPEVPTASDVGDLLPPDEPAPGNPDWDVLH